MTRVALYARDSSDHQREASIEDQLRLCLEQARRDTWNVVATYKDAGISGSSMILRGTGLVNNELYIGRLLWNRLR